MPAKKFGLQISTEEDKGEKVDLNDYVSHGGSLHLAKGFSVTHEGLFFFHLPPENDYNFFAF